MDESQRLDVYVVQQLPTLPRTYAKRLIESEKVLVNEQVVTKAGYRLRDDDKVKILEHETNLQIPQIDIPVLYEDDDCVVINKPAGLLTHSKGAFDAEATVATWLSARYTGEARGERDGIVHRLDRGTSGVMICAKNDETLKYLQKQFSTRKVKKTYVALVEGRIRPEEAIIDMPIERNPKEPQRFRVGINGKSAMTEYKTLEVIEKNSHIWSILELKPTTGRTHQLRVHLAHLKHPIVGDTFYKGHPAGRLYLHAKSLELTLPSRQRKVFSVPILPEFEDPKL